MSRVTFRNATSKDARAIAQLHSSNWQHAYRNILTDDYLDKVVVADRMAFWTNRLSQGVPASIYIRLAENQNLLMGFVCAIHDHDSTWGTLIDNLHVRPAAQGTGLGRQLVQDAAAWVVRQEEQQGMYLWVYKENLNARGFYERMGGEAVEERTEQQPDGFEADIVRYAWRRPGLLIQDEVCC